MRALNCNGSCFIHLCFHCLLLSVSLHLRRLSQHFFFFFDLQTYHSSPGGHSSCSSEPSPLSSGGGASNNNNDSGVEVAALSGELGLQEESPLVDSTVTGLQLRRAAGHGNGVTVRLENIKRERLKSVRDSCHWGGATLQPLQGQRSSVKLPPIPAVGRC